VIATVTPLVLDSQSPLASDLTRALRRAGFDVDERAGAELDVSDRRACDRAVARAGASIVIDCSGADDGSLDEPTQEALELMHLGARNVALAAVRAGAHSVYISSARVFGSPPARPLLESDPPTPATPIGDATLRAEQTVARLNEQHTIVRSSWLYGPGLAPAFDDLLARAKASDQLAVGTSQMSGPTYAPHLAHVLLALVRRPVYGIFHRAAEGSCTELQLARTLVRLERLPTSVHAVPAEDAPSAAMSSPAILASRRPELAVIPHWRLGMGAFLTERRTLALRQR
jgi:dTDP-4-dehydrorhamnose reductase